MNTGLSICNLFSVTKRECYQGADLRFLSTYTSDEQLRSGFVHRTQQASYPVGTLTVPERVSHNIKEQVLLGNQQQLRYSASCILKAGVCC